MQFVSKLLKLSVYLILMFVMSGCAISYIDSEGNHNMVGFMNITMQGVENDKLKAGDKIEVTNVGILLSNGPLYSGVSVGYNKESTTSIKNDALVLINEQGKGKEDDKNKSE
ncbi:hypothetical protein [Colwellia polaris]|jgi:hypothetical protein|uniref:hypothetical protein n=1 Tax=Colwellia polaris TaxID=326537 RepID=UPI000A174305|nr:hypothetical protein [Colwellia polaris]|tara:strand:- start:1490 stop:1825 length:336 start_codon:yes stop_codon:yes gene_type:complete